MSTHKVEIVAIDDVLVHPNADRLEIVKVKDWNVVTGKGLYQKGDKAIYIPIDSILPVSLEAKLFPIDSKIRLTNSRIKTIKLRGAISQGMVVRPEMCNMDSLKVGTDVTTNLGITKYEPPSKGGPSMGGKGISTKKQCNTNFRKYTAIENAKNYPGIFTAEDQVVVTCKIHGTSFRAGYVEFEANTLWKKIKSFLGFAPSHEFVFGSHNVQLQDKLLYRGYYDTNIYAEAVIKYNLRKILKPGEVVYGEIFGDAIQKDYNYGCRIGERKLVLFDLMIDGRYVNYADFKQWCINRRLPSVPEIYSGVFDLDKIKAMTLGPSVLCPKQKVREGVVVKPLEESVAYIGRKILKFISDEYLLKDNTDFH